MKYFKYKNENKTFKTVFNEQLKQLNEKEKKLYRKKKLYSVLLLCFWFLILAIGITMVIILSKLLPEMFSWMGLIIRIIGIAGVFFLSLFIVVKISGKFVHINYPEKSKEIIHKACQHLREYYEFNYPYIITKCYYCSNEIFTNHDICLFFVKNKLRITSDIYNGFVDGHKDLGCYEFDLSEIKYQYTKFGERFSTEIAAVNIKFILGMRAKKFIETEGKNIFSKLK